MKKCSFEGLGNSLNILLCLSFFGVFEGAFCQLGVWVITTYVPSGLVVGKTVFFCGKMGVSNIRRRECIGGCSTSLDSFSEHFQG